MAGAAWDNPIPGFPGDLSSVNHQCNRYFEWKTMTMCVVDPKTMLNCDDGSECHNGICNNGNSCSVGGQCMDSSIKCPTPAPPTPPPTPAPPTPSPPTLPPTPPTPSTSLVNKKQFLENICMTKDNKTIPKITDYTKIPTVFNASLLKKLSCIKLNLCGIKTGRNNADQMYYPIRDRIVDSIRLIGKYYNNDASVSHFNKNYKIIDPSTSTNIWCGLNDGSDNFCKNYYNAMKTNYNNLYADKKVKSSHYNQWINNGPNCSQDLNNTNNNCATVMQNCYPNDCSSQLTDNYPNRMCITVGVDGNELF